MEKEKNYWDIRAAGNDSADVFIFEFIGSNFFEEGMSAKWFAQTLMNLRNVRTLNVRINSPGGSVFDGQAIYNTLRAHPATVNVFIDGVAASIASVIAMAGDVITMPSNSLMMIHDPAGLVRGTANDMRDMAAILDKIKGTLIAAYQRKTNLPEYKVASLMADETWMTAAEAKDRGFADVVDEIPVQVAASANLAAYRRVPSHLVAGLAGQRHEVTAMAHNHTPTNELPGRDADETEIRAAWNSNPELRAEFGEFETFAAYTRNQHLTSQHGRETVR